MLCGGLPRSSLRNPLYYYHYNHCTWQLVKWLHDSIYNTGSSPRYSKSNNNGQSANIGLLHKTKKLLISCGFVSIWLEASHTWMSFCLSLKTETVSYIVCTCLCRNYVCNYVPVHNYGRNYDCSKSVIWIVITLHNKQLRLRITTIITLHYINFFALYRISRIKQPPFLPLKLSIGTHWCAKVYYYNQSVLTLMPRDEPHNYHFMWWH